MYFTYILYSLTFGKYYIGQSNDVKKCLQKHNSGQVASTKPYKPWKLVLAIEKSTRSEAMVLERKLKNLNSKKLLLIY